MKEKRMTRKTKTLLLITLLLAAVFILGAGRQQGPFSPYVDINGTITLPSDFRSGWAHLGTWSVTSKQATGPNTVKTSPGTGFHEVYTQPDAAKKYKKTGKWPDGAVLVMEVRPIQWDDLSTGHVMYGGDPSEWFVMVKSGKDRFKGHANWGDGWGWALFKADDPKKNVSADYKNDCLSCHEPAKDTDWVFIQGYPALR